MTAHQEKVNQDKNKTIQGQGKITEFGLEHDF
jgi:hypothetical protein